MTSQPNEQTPRDRSAMADVIAEGEEKGYVRQDDLAVVTEHEGLSDAEVDTIEEAR